MNSVQPPAAVGRREFLKLAGGVAVGAALPVRAAGGAPYRVGVGREADPYAATRRAVAASERWNPAAIAGRRVVIKPNLVVPVGPETGTVTDAQVVRALVDLALEAGAAEVLIVEQSLNGAPFGPCGYGFFADYDPYGRVRLVDLAGEPVVRAPVARGLAYASVLLPAVLFEPDTFLVSAAKLKVHNQAQATLAVKNLFGLPPIPPYQNDPARSRFGMHDRSISETTVDINRARPADFAVVDGIWGMETVGPWAGDPVRMDTVIAGDNPLAVDLVCLHVMQLPVTRVQHLQFAMATGMGPAAADQIEVRGDPLPTRPFVVPPFLPVAGYPLTTPAAIAPARGESTTIRCAIGARSLLRAEIVLPSDASAALPRVRLLADWTDVAPGAVTLAWDGRADDGTPAAPGRYGIRVTLLGYGMTQVLHTFGWVRVLA